MLHLPKVESTEAAHIWQRSPRQHGGRMTTLDRYGKSSISPLTKHILAIDLPFLYVTLLTDRRPYPPPLQSIRGLTEALSTIMIVHPWTDRSLYPLSWYSVHGLTEALFTIMIIHPWTDRSPYLPSWYSAQYRFEPGNSLSSKKKYSSKHTHTHRILWSHHVAHHSEVTSQNSRTAF